MAAKRDIGPDLLRGLAILMVMATHMPYDHVPAAFEMWWGRYGWFGVDVFFVLSGYLIGSELLRPVYDGRAPDLVVFYIKRAFRILPVFWLVLAIYVFLPTLREAPTMAPAWRFLTFTVNLGLDVRTARSFSHAWSLCVEEHFYLILPWLVLLFRKSNMRWLPLVFGIALAAGGMILRHVLWQDAQAMGGGWADFLRLVYYPSWCRLDGLIAGVSLAALRLFHQGAWARWARPVWLLPLALACISVAIGMTVATGQILNEISSVVVYPLFSLGVMALLAALVQLEPHLGALRWSGLGFIAAISYSLYLCQKLVFAADIRWLPAGVTQGWWAVVVFYVSAIAVAVLLWWAVERPFLALRARLIRRRETART
ncbi:MAG: acyltransferase [Asticcacaulis sp.]